MSQPFKTFLAVITTAFLATTSPPESTMRVQTWQQSEFITPGRYEYTDTGDFWSIDGFIPSVDGHALERMPSWTGHIDFVSNFVQPYGALYDAAYRRYLFVGTSEYHEEGDRLGVMLIPAADLSPYGLTTHEDTAPSELGGNHKQNLIYALGKFWWIGSDGDVYYCDNPYGTTISNPYTAEDAIAIIPVRDTIFLVNDSDEIWYYDTTTSAFVIYYDTLLPLNVKHAFHYRENIVLFAQHEDGSHAIYLVDDHPPATLRQLTRLDYETGILVSTASNAKWATAWAIHDDKLFFSPGSYMTTSPPSMGAMNQSDLYPIYAFDGNSIEYVDTIDPPITPKAWGLLRWRHRLLLYFISAGEQYIYAYHKGRFVQILDATYTVKTAAPRAGRDSTSTIIPSSLPRGWIWGALPYKSTSPICPLSSPMPSPTSPSRSNTAPSQGPGPPQYRQPTPVTSSPTTSPSPSMPSNSASPSPTPATTT